MPKRAPGRGKYDRSRSATERRREQRGLLLTAAAEVFAAHGWAGATVAAICSKSGMSRRTFYDHFSDLKDALLELHAEAARFAWLWVEGRVAATRDPLEKVKTGVEAFLQVLALHGDVARVIFREVRALGPRYEARRQAELARFAELTKKGLLAAKRKGLLSRAPDELTLYALVAAVEAVGMRFVERREEHRAVEAAPALVELIIRAFR